MKLLLPNNRPGRAIPRYYIGDDAVRVARDSLARRSVVSVDIETEGLAELSYRVKAIIVSDDTEAVVLDATDPAHAAVCREALAAVPELTFHNSAFDAPPLVTNGLMRLADVRKIYDTLITSRLAYTSEIQSKGLEALESRLLGGQFLHAVKDRVAYAGKVRGYTKGETFSRLQYSDPVYTMYAAWDAIVTHSLRGPTHDAAVRQLTDHPFGKYGTDDPAGLIEHWQKVNRLYVHRSCKGLEFDAALVTQRQTEIDGRHAELQTTLTSYGITDPSNRNQLIAALEQDNALPRTHPHTATGKPSTAKAHLDKIEHPSAAAFREYDQLRRLRGYMTSVEQIASYSDGKVHPRINVLGAATGRASIGDPPLQQFQGDSRHVILGDNGDELTSIDYTSIEPLLAAALSGDRMVLDLYDGAEDLYEPMAEAAGIVRKQAKIQSLADLYGQGIKKMMSSMGIEDAEAVRLRHLLRSRMPRTAAFIEYSRRWSERYGKTFTLDGRIVDVDAGHAYKGTNYSVQGSGSDLLHHHMVQLWDAGMEDAFYMSIHDELVVSKSAAAEVHQIMSTPSPRLVELTGRAHSIRTDRQDMGLFWQAV